MIQARQAVTQRIEAVGGIESQDAFGTPTVVTGSVATTMKKLETSASGEVAHEIVEVIESASPGLVSDLNRRDAKQTTEAISVWVALLTVLSAIIELYQHLHSAPPSTEMIVQIFNQTTTYVVNAPLPPGR